MQSENASKRVRGVLDAYATAIRVKDRDAILSHHSPDALFYDVLPPMEYQAD